MSQKRPDLPSAIDAVVAKALAKDPADRQETCQQLVTESRAALGLAAPPRRRRLPTPMVAVAGLLALLAAWFGSTLLDSAEAKPLDKLLRIDPASNAVVQSIDVGDRASSVATGDGYVWVTSMAERDLWRIDPATGASIVTPVDGTPMDVIVRGDLAVVANGPFEVSLDRIDVKSGKLIETIPLKGARGAFRGVAAGDEGIWVAACGYGGGNVARLTENTTGNVNGGETTLDHVPILSENPNFVFGHTPDFPAYTDVAVGEGSVWLTLDSGPAIRRVDPTGLQDVEVIDIPFRHDPSPSAEGRCGSRPWFPTSLPGSTLTRRPSRWSSQWGAARTAWPSAAATSGSRTRSTARSAAWTRGPGGSLPRSRSRGSRRISSWGPTACGSRRTRHEAWRGFTAPSRPPLVRRFFRQSN